MSIRKRINLGMDMLKKKTTIICLAIVALTPWIIYDLIFYDVATARKLASFYASLATVIGVIWAIINVTNAGK